MSVRALALAAALALPFGCVAWVEDRCPGCSVIEWRAPRLPALRKDARAFVVIVPGAFGFGDEWNEVVAALRAREDLEFAVFWTRGMSGDPSAMARSLTATLQGALARLPDGANEVVVLGHSLGGLIADYGARDVAVPDGKRLRVYAIDPPRMKLPGASRELPAVPPRVEIERIHAAAAPGGEPPPHESYLGGVSHDASVALAALPVIRALP